MGDIKTAGIIHVVVGLSKIGVGSTNLLGTPLMDRPLTDRHTWPAGRRLANSFRLSVRTQCVDAIRRFDGTQLAIGEGRGDLHRSCLLSSGRMRRRMVCETKRETERERNSAEGGEIATTREGHGGSENGSTFRKALGASAAVLWTLGYVYSLPLKVECTGGPPSVYNGVRCCPREQLSMRHWPSLIGFDSGGAGGGWNTRGDGQFIGKRRVLPFLSDPNSLWEL